MLLTMVIEAGQPQLWVHGHRIVCNPNGYVNASAAFDPALVVEVA